jgi:hypothetical protein
MDSVAELNARLDKLQAQLPELRAEYEDDGDFMEAFAGIANGIEEFANGLDDGHDCDHCWMIFAERIDAMLRGIGIQVDPLLPGSAA